MRFILYSLLLVYFAVSVKPWDSESLNIMIPDVGGLYGRYMESLSGRGIRAFLGIPYAEAPTGHLRFRPPVGKQAWHTVIDATNGFRLCVQQNFFNPSAAVEPIGDEDCLYLNVYVPVQYDTANIKKLPVMVWIHGGAFQGGFSLQYGPEYILDHDVILVTINYRLGVFGFFSTGQKESPGNNGLKDQVMALKWVNKYIDIFGGDPDQITVFGESAGSSSVSYLMTSPLAKGLFKRAIAMSGSTLNQWSQPSLPGVPAKNAEKVGELLDCPKTGDDWVEMMMCLRQKTAAEIAKVTTHFVEWANDPMVVFGPVIEHEHDGAFISKHPRNEKNAWGNSIDLITGVTLDEGLLKSVPIYFNKEHFNELSEDFDKLMPLLLSYKHFEDTKKQALTDEFVDYYLDGNELDDKNVQNLTDLFTDGLFLAGMNEFLQIRFADEQNKDAKTFVYLFAHKGEASLTELFGGGSKEFGVCHGDDIQYIFPFLKEAFKSAVPSKESIEVRKTVSKLWTEFAISGLDGCQKCTSLPKWEPTKSFPLDYLRIGVAGSENTELFKMENGLLSKRSNFWRTIISKYFANVESIGKDEL